MAEGVHTRKSKKILSGEVEGLFLALYSERKEGIGSGFAAKLCRMLDAEQLQKVKGLLLKEKGDVSVTELSKGLFRSGSQQSKEPVSAEGAVPNEQQPYRMPKDYKKQSLPGYE